MEMLRDWAVGVKGSTSRIFLALAGGLASWWGPFGGVGGGTLTANRIHRVRGMGDGKMLENGRKAVSKKFQTIVVAISAAMLGAGAMLAVAQPKDDKKPEAKPAEPAKSTDGAAPAAAKPGGLVTDPEAPDGTKMTVVARHEIKLVLEDLKIGDGAEATPGCTVVAAYRGVLASNGQEFDSSVKQGGPLTFSLNRVVVGWAAGIPGMKVGGIRKITVPWQFGYGTKGHPAGIPPMADLVFSVELKDVKDTGSTPR